MIHEEGIKSPAESQGGEAAAQANHHVAANSTVAFNHPEPAA